MKHPLPYIRPQDHPSYLLHRRQIWTQVILPMLLAVVVFAGLIFIISTAAFRGNDDVTRWAAISTIWLVLPVMIAGFALLFLLGALIYLAAYLTTLIPPYSYQAQRYVYRITGGVKRGLEVAVKPMLLIRMIGNEIKGFIARQ